MPSEQDAQHSAASSARPTCWWQHSSPTSPPLRVDSASQFRPRVESAKGPSSGQVVPSEHSSTQGKWLWSVAMRELLILKDQVQVTKGSLKKPSPGSRAASEPESSAHRTPRARLSQTLRRGLHLVSSFKKHKLSQSREVRCLHTRLGNAAAGAISTGFALASVRAEKQALGVVFCPERPDLKGPSGHSAKTSWNARAGDRDALPATSKSHGPPGCETCNSRG